MRRCWTQSRYTQIIKYSFCINVSSMGQGNRANTSVRFSDSSHYSVKVSRWRKKVILEKNMSSSDEEVIVLSLLACEEEENRKRKWVHEINQKRDVFDEFHHLYPDLQKDKNKFFKYFRMSQEKFQELLNLLKPSIEHKNTKFRRAISCEERLSVCMRFLATGDSFGNIAFSYRLGETTVRKIVHETCEAIWKVLGPIFLPEPNRDIWEEKEKEFRNRWNFPNCLGAIDGKHVVFQKPANSGSLYFSYKKTCSIILLAVVDASYKFTMIDVGAFGKNSDGGVFSRCAFGQRFLKGQLNFPPDKPLPGTTTAMPHVLVGDEAFPLHKNLMRPYPAEQVKRNEKNKIFNYRLSRARNVSENAFGILSKKFRIYQRRLEMTPEHLDLIVLATCTLHNFLRHDSEELFVEISRDESSKDCSLENLPSTSGAFSGSSLAVRENFKEYFNSSEGSVTWQTPIIRQGRKQ